MTYVLLIYRSAGSPATSLDGHRALQDEASRARELHAVALLDDITTARSVRLEAGRHAIEDGPFVETKEWLVGLYLVDCADEDEAMRRAKMICSDGHAVEVRAVRWHA
jgi:hypothetical protein